jgi:hypothetical protein
MKKLYPFLYAALVASFFAPGFAGVFRPAAYLRWPLLAVLAPVTIGMLASRPLRVPREVLAALFAFMFYCLLAAFWSENALLSILKLLAYSVTICTLLLGPSVFDGWGKNPFRPLVPIVIACVGSAVVAFVTGVSYGQSNFSGYVWNSNFFGSMIAYSMPWLIFVFWSAWGRRSVLSGKQRIFYIAFVGTTSLLLLLSRSRSAMLMVIVGVSFAFAQSRPTRKLAVVYGLCAGLLLLYLLYPGVFGVLRTTYIYKSDNMIFDSRSQQFGASWEKAKEGGWLGYGFGVSAGLSSTWSLQWSGLLGLFSQYSREKGSTQFAVMEELGLFGLVLYVILWGVLGRSIFRWGRQLHENREHRFLRFLVFGYCMGALVNSLFEAWFLSPSPETAAFWATLGIGFAVLYSPAAKVPLPRFTTSPQVSFQRVQV